MEIIWINGVLDGALKYLKCSSLFSFNLSSLQRLQNLDEYTLQEYST